MSPGHFAPVAQRTPPFHLINHLEQHSLLLGQRQPVEPAAQARGETLTNAALSARYALAARQHPWYGARFAGPTGHRADQRYLRHANLAVVADLARHLSAARGDSGECCFTPVVAGMAYPHPIRLSSGECHDQ
jgi:hypothetical protein